MAKFEKKIEAHKLRRKGKSIKSIAEELGVAKSTASLWCREVTLTKTQSERLTKNQIAAGHRGRMIGAEMNRQKKIKNIEKQEKEANRLVGTLSHRDKLMLGIGLYWGEGVKSGSSCASLVNSDPDILLVMIEWFEQLGVKRSDLRPYVYISEIHRSRESRILAHWSKTLRIPMTQFKNIIFLKNRPKKVYDNHGDYFGVVALRVRKSTSLKYKILGMVEACKQTRKI